MTRTAVQRRYVLTDWISANIAWFLFNLTRFEIARVYNSFNQLSDFLSHPHVLLGQLIVPLFMVGVFWLSGYYNIVIRRSRINEFVETFASTVVISLVLFFVFILDDIPQSVQATLALLAILFIYTFFIVYIPRLLFTRSIARKIHNRQLSFKTAVVGTGSIAAETIHKLDSMPRSLGYDIHGVIGVDGVINDKRLSHPYLGPLSEIQEIVKQEGIEWVIIALSEKALDRSENLAHLYALDIPVYRVAHRNSILGERIRESNIYSTVPMSPLNGEDISFFEHNLKLLFSWVVSLIAFILLIPLYLVIAIAIKIDSKGPILYRQERLGFRQKPFDILKFRTMREDAEDGTPLLSSLEDNRITTLGRFLRKFRLDEIPQFWNVLKGDMVLVGPRPERRYFVDQIIEKAPHYSLTMRVKPGITSWGMVKYGYACSVEEMIERLDYDMLYIENNSFLVDLRILVYTFRTIVTGKGI